MRPRPTGSPYLRSKRAISRPSIRAPSSSPRPRSPGVPPLSPQQVEAFDLLHEIGEEICVQGYFEPCALRGGIAQPG